MSAELNVRAWEAAFRYSLEVEAPRGPGVLVITMLYQTPVMIKFAAV